MAQIKTGISHIARAVHMLFATFAAGALISAASAATVDTARVIVSFKPGAMARVKAAVAAVRGDVKEDIFGMDAIAIEVPRLALKALQANPNITFVEEDQLRAPLALIAPSTGTPYMLGQSVPYGIAMVQADRLPDTNTGNRKVCIIDSGYDRAHEDLAANAVTGEYDSGTGWCYTDQNSHGTHVAGTIAAINNSGAGVVGVNPNRSLKLHIVKVFGASGWAYSSSLASAANKCGADGANVISMSLGGGAANATEQNAFASLASRGVLNLAAAGNSGDTSVMYPAGYSSVMMVGAVNEAKQWASFSQYNNKVEIVAPGVGVLSTVPGAASGTATADLQVGARVFSPRTLTGAPVKSATAPLASFGNGSVLNTAVSGKVCLIARGTVDFATKIGNCQKSGGVGAVIYNNMAGAFSGTLGSAVVSIPAVTASDTEGASLRTQLGQSATVAMRRSSGGYSYFDGTSMATPHVAGVAALVWSYFPTCTGNQIRTSLSKSAQDLGPVGPDTKYGFGLVQARAAYDRIRSVGCGN